MRFRFLSFVVLVGSASSARGAPSPAAPPYQRECHEFLAQIEPSRLVGRFSRASEEWADLESFVAHDGNGQWRRLYRREPALGALAQVRLNFIDIIARARRAQEGTSRATDRYEAAVGKDNVHCVPDEISTFHGLRVLFEEARILPVVNANRKLLRSIRQLHLDRELVWPRVVTDGNFGQRIASLRRIAASFAELAERAEVIVAACDSKIDAIAHEMVKLARTRADQPSQNQKRL